MDKEKIQVEKKELENLIKEYPTSKKYILDNVKMWCEYYSKFPNEKLDDLFEKGKKKIYLQKIKDDLILVNTMWEEKEIIKLAPEPLKADFIFSVETKDKLGNVQIKEKVSIDLIAEYLLKTYIFKTIYGTKTEKVYLYEKGIYSLKGREKIKTEVENLLKESATTHIVNEVFEKIKRRTAVDKKDFEFVEEGMLCLENGIYNLKEKTFREHSPDIYFKRKLPITYNPKSTCRKVIKFFNETLYKEDVKLIQEWIGFILYNKYFEKKSLILFGEKDTGKTITLDLITSFIGEENTTSLSLQNISFAKSFDLLSLKDKYVNIFDDLGAKDINDTAGFKIATGGGYIPAEEKFGDRIQFKTYAKLTFATNKIPPIKDVDDDAYYSRWMPIPCDNQIPKNKQDKFLLSKLTTKEEISGLFNWAVEGFQRLLKNNGFSFQKSTEELKQILQRSSHPLAAFSQDCLEEQLGNKISKQEMFEVYTNWCKKRRKARFSKDKLGKNLERFVPYILSIGGKERSWLNVKLRINHDRYDTFEKNMRA